MLFKVENDTSSYSSKGTVSKSVPLKSEYLRKSKNYLKWNLIYPSHSDFNKLYIQASTTPLLLQSAWRSVPSYFNPHFCITFPEFGLLGSCCDSIRFTPTSLMKKGIIALNASVVNHLCHHLLPIQYPI